MQVINACASLRSGLGGRSFSSSRATSADRSAENTSPGCDAITNGSRRTERRSCSSARAIQDRHRLFVGSRMCPSPVWPTRSERRMPLMGWARGRSRKSSGLGSGGGDFTHGEKDIRQGDRSGTCDKCPASSSSIAPGSSASFIGTATSQIILPANCCSSSSRRDERPGLWKKPRPERSSLQSKRPVVSAQKRGQVSDRETGYGDVQQSIIIEVAEPQ